MAFFNAKNIKQSLVLSGAIFSTMLASMGAVASAASPGSMQITEFMANPASVTDTNGEWVELKNASSETINLTSWDIDGSTISGSVFVRPGHSVVICKNANTSLNDGVICDATSGFSLTNTSDTINLRDEENAVVDTLSYGDGIIQEGRSNARSLVSETSKKYSTNNFGTPAHNQTSPPVTPGEIRVHHSIDLNRNGWPFDADEAHFKGRTIRLYQVNAGAWIPKGAVETTGKYYTESAKFVVDPGKYALCEVATPDFTQSFSRTIAGWYSAPEVGVSNLSGAADEYAKCIPVNVSSNVFTSHVFGDMPVL